VEVRRLLQRFDLVLILLVITSYFLHSDTHESILIVLSAAALIIIEIVVIYPELSYLAVPTDGSTLIGYLVIISTHCMVTLEFLMIVIVYRVKDILINTIVAFAFVLGFHDLGEEELQLVSLFG
jgi:hypothetical protein